MFAAVSCFEVMPGFEDPVKEAFTNRPKLVENYAGFIRLDVLSPKDNPAEIWLLTYWENEETFNIWHRKHLKDSHAGIPKGLKLVPHSFKLRAFHHITS